MQSSYASDTTSSRQKPTCATKTCKIIYVIIVVYFNQQAHACACVCLGKNDTTNNDNEKFRVLTKFCKAEAKKIVSFLTLDF